MTIEKFTTDMVSLANCFDCGNIIIDNFIKSKDALDSNQGITYVFLSDKKDFIIGYYNICAGRVDMKETINGTIYYEPMGSSININYLALHKDYQRKMIIENSSKKIYLGDLILRDCEKRIINIRNEIGISFVTLYSTEEGYNLYHTRNGYEIFEDDMSTFVQTNDSSCYKMYKCVDDIIS